MRRALGLILLGSGLLSAGCDGDLPPARPDGSSGLPEGLCASTVEAAVFFSEEGCTRCHAGRTAPDLRVSALDDLVNAPSTRRPGRLLVVPGRPEESELYLRLVGPQPADYDGAWWMPAGTIGPHPAPGPVENWIRRNAEIACDGDAGVLLPSDPPVTNPNDYDQDLLFTCVDPTAPTSSPARLRRINDVELSLASGNPVDSTTSNTTVRSNPLGVPSRFYSTRAGDFGVDITTLDLLLITLPVASQPWVSRGQGPGAGGRFWTVYDGTPSTFYYETVPSDADRAAWVDAMLRQGVLFRAPTDDERSRVRALLDAELLAESSADDRTTTLRTVTTAAHLMAGALFRSEMGAGPADGMRRRLSNEELGLSLGRVIGAHPVSSTLWGEPPTDVGAHPDWSRPLRSDGQLAEIRDAIEDGSIAEPETLARLLSRYRGGVDPLRLDVTLEQFQPGSHDTVRRERGEYWLSEGIAGFFREWLEVENAETAFKDTANATSRWVTPRSNAEDTGYGLATSPYRRETLLPMLDDTIARAVVETEAGGGDVLRTLLTTRTFRVASNLVGVDYARPCTAPADCGDSRVGACYTAIGFCADFGSSEVNRVFGLGTDVPDTHEARWVTLPASERAGVLTHPAWLAAHGGNFEDDASVVHRGRWIRENLLCDDVPGLELVSVPALLGPSAPELSARDRVHAATEASGSACVACHAEMNPYGYPFEIYNHAGFLRASDHGRAPDGSSSITNAPDPLLNRDYADAIDLAEAFADSPYVRRCFVRNVFRYFMGRDETPADACTLSTLETAFAGGSFFALLEALVTSDAFLYRHDAGGAP